MNNLYKIVDIPDGAGSVNINLGVYDTIQDISCIDKTYYFKVIDKPPLIASWIIQKWQLSWLPQTPFTMSNSYHTIGLVNAWTDYLTCTVTYWYNEIYSNTYNYIVIIILLLIMIAPFYFSFSFVKDIFKIKKTKNDKNNLKNTDSIHG